MLPPLPPDLGGDTNNNPFIPPPVEILNHEEENHPIVSVATPLSVVHSPGDETGDNIPPVQGLSDLAARFGRFERHLVHYGMAVNPTEDIDDPDLDHPIRYRLAEIQTDANALNTFVNKNKDAYQKYASRLANEPTSGLHAYYAARYCFAVRYGQRALGLPANQVLPWPERLQRLFGYAQNPELQQLVKEDMALTPAKVANPITPLPLDYPELDVYEEQGQTITPKFALPARKQENNDAAQPGRFDSKKMRAVKLNRMSDQAHVIEPDKEP